MLKKLTRVISINPSLEKIASYGVLIVFLLSLLGAINDINRNPIFPFIPMLIFAILIVCTIKITRSKKFNFSSLGTPLFIGINCFGLLILLSALYSKYPLLTAKRSLQYILVTNSLYIMLFCISDLNKLFKDVAKITITFTLLASIFGIVIHHFGTAYSVEGIWMKTIKILGLELNQRAYHQRVASFVGNPNILGTLLMFSILSCLYFLKESKRSLYIFLMLILFYALLLTGSRASIISVLGGSMIFITYSFLNIGLASFIFKIFVIVLSFFIGAYLIINPDLIHELFSFLNRKFSSPFSGREIAWSALISQIKETPFLGVGYRISTEAILRENSINISHSHNLFLTIVSEIGIIGFLLFSFLYIFPSIKFILNKNTEKISNLQLISNSILLAILINQFFEDMFEPFRFFFIWMFFVLFIIYTQKGQKIK